MKTPALSLCLAALLSFPALVHSQATATLSQQEALRAFPELAKEGSDFHQRFLTKMRVAKADNSPALNRNDWPMVLAMEVAKELEVKPVKVAATAPGAGLSKIVKLSVAEVAASPFTVEGAMVELSGIREIKVQEVEKGVYEATIWGADFSRLKATLPLAVAAAVESSQRLFISVTKPDKRETEVTIHGNQARYESLKTVPTVSWSK